MKFVTALVVLSLLLVSACTGDDSGGGTVPPLTPTDESENDEDDEDESDESGDESGDDENGEDESNGGDIDINDIIDDIIRNTRQSPEALRVDDAPTAGDLTTEAGMVAFLDTVWADLEVTWREILTAYPGDPAINKRWVVSGENVVLPCTGVNELGEIEYTTMDTQYDNAFWCPTDNTVYMAVGTMIRALTTDLLGMPLDIPGDAVVAGILAHEYGHGVADYMRDAANEQGWPYRLTFSEQIDGGDPVPRPNELLADCFAGIWFHSAYYKGYLEPGDLDEVIHAFEVVGDNPGHISHGSPQERRGAFEGGYNHGRTSTCIDTYAPWVDINTGEIMWLEEENRHPVPDVLAELSNQQVTIDYRGDASTGLEALQVFTVAIGQFYGVSSYPQLWWFETGDTYTGCDFPWSPLSTGYCEGDAANAAAIIIGSQLMTDVYAEPTYGPLSTVLLIGQQASRHVIATGAVGQFNGDAGLVGDCLTGLWLGSYRGQTNREHIEGAYQAIDKQFGPGVLSSPSTRTDWFLAGYTADNVSACV